MQLLSRFLCLNTICVIQMQGHVRWSRQVWWNSLRCETCHSERRISGLIGEQLVVGMRLLFRILPLIWYTCGKFVFYWRFFYGNIQISIRFFGKKILCVTYLKFVNISQLPRHLSVLFSDILLFSRNESKSVLRKLTFGTSDRLAQCTFSSKVEKFSYNRFNNFRITRNSRFQIYFLFLRFNTPVFKFPLKTI